MFVEPVIKGSRAVPEGFLDFLTGKLVRVVLEVEKKLPRQSFLMSLLVGGTVELGGDFGHEGVDYLIVVASGDKVAVKLLDFKSKVSFVGVLEPESSDLSEDKAF